MIDKKWFKKFKSKTVLLRLDLNVPISNSDILDESRITQSLETVQGLYEVGAKVIVVTHLGKPKGESRSDLTLRPIVESFAQHSKLPCFLHLGPLVKKEIKKQLRHSVVFLENIRFNKGEESCADSFSKELAGLASHFVNDAFSVSHRKHASVVGVAKYLPSSPGPSMMHEIENLKVLLSGPKKPFWIVMGGAKLKTKIPLIDALRERVDGFVLGGGIANTFYKALGFEIGESLYDSENISWAKDFFKKSQNKKSPALILPEEVLVKTGTGFKKKKYTQVSKNENILDTTLDSISNLFENLDSVKTIFWNGAFGAFEMKGAAEGTLTLAKLLGDHSAKVYIGGGETLASVKMANAEDSFHFKSMAGGATLYYLSGKKLPGLEVLKL